MGFIAIKNKKVCPFNNEDEKFEILEDFYEEQCLGQVEIFDNNELKKALEYANVEKISGYSLFYEMSNYDKLLKMKREGFIGKEPNKKDRYYGLYIAENHGNCFSFMINDMYYLNTNKCLLWVNNDLLGIDNTAPKEEMVESFENSIFAYAKDTHQDLQVAGYQYIVTFKRIFGKYPWSIIKKGSFKKKDDKIEFSEIYKIIGEDPNEKGKLKQFSKEGPIQIFDHSICEISHSYQEIHMQLKNEDILDIIRKSNWHYEL